MLVWYLGVELLLLSGLLEGFGGLILGVCLVLLVLMLTWCLFALWDGC